MKHFTLAKTFLFILIASATLWLGMEASGASVILEQKRSNCLALKGAGMCGCPIDSCKCLHIDEGCRGSGSSDKACEPVAAQ